MRFLTKQLYCAYKPSQFMLPTSRYDKKKADRAVTFIENLCHTKGKWAGTPFWLLPWQEQLIRDIFGIVKADGNRQFRTAFVEICKKVGKSELAAAVALYLLYADNEPSAEVYGAAADRQQASIVFDVAKQMVEMSPALMKRSKLMGATKRIVNYGNAGYYQVLSAEVGGKYGFSVSGLVFDEIHTQPNRQLYDVLTKGSSDARQNPLHFIITRLTMINVLIFGQVCLEAAPEICVYHFRNMVIFCSAKTNYRKPLKNIEMRSNTIRKTGILKLMLSIAWPPAYYLMAKFKKV